MSSRLGVESAICPGASGYACAPSGRRAAGGRACGVRGFESMRTVHELIWHLTGAAARHLSCRRGAGRCPPSPTAPAGTGWLVRFADELVVMWALPTGGPSRTDPARGRDPEGARTKWQVSWLVLPGWSSATFERAEVRGFELGYLARSRVLARVPMAQRSARRDRVLRGRVRYAYETTAVYRDLWPDGVGSVGRAEDLPALSPLTRELCRTLPVSERLARGFDESNTVASRTSGSSGIPVEIRNCARDLRRVRSIVLEDLLSAGAGPRDRVATFRVYGFRPHGLERLGVMPFLHVDTSADLSSQVEMYRSARPTFLFGFPSVILALVDELERLGAPRPPSMNGLLLGGEHLAPAGRARLEEYFGARVTMLYGSVEVVTIARSCRVGALHVCMDDVVVEVVRDDGTTSTRAGEGEALVTRLHGQAMPFVRYQVGDRIELRDDVCACGSEVPVVVRVHGRSEDYLVGPDGRRRNGDHVVKRIDGHPDLARVQVLQHGPGILTVLAVPVPGGGATLVEDLTRSLADVVPDFRCRVRVVDRIQPEPNGKVRLVRSVGP